MASEAGPVGGRLGGGFGGRGGRMPQSHSSLLLGQPEPSPLLCADVERLYFVTPSLFPYTD